MARIVNVAWFVTRDRIERQSRRPNDWSGYYFDRPDLVVAR